MYIYEIHCKLPFRLTLELNHAYLTPCRILTPHYYSFGLVTGTSVSARTIADKGRKLPIVLLLHFYIDRGNYTGYGYANCATICDIQYLKVTALDIVNAHL